MGHAASIFSQGDVQRLEPILSAVLDEEHSPPPHLSHLATVLQNNDSLPAAAIPRDVVTLNSIVWIRNVSHDERTTLQIVLPEQADMERRRITVLAPIGAALLGRKEGQQFTVFLPFGRMQRFEIEKVLQQPLADGGRDFSRAEEAIS